jgi:hypothetical protein
VGLLVHCLLMGCRVASPGILVAPCSEPPGRGFGEYWNWPPDWSPAASSWGAGFGRTIFGGVGPCTGRGVCSSLINWDLSKLRRVYALRSLYWGSATDSHPLRH